MAFVRPATLALVLAACAVPTFVSAEAQAQSAEQDIATARDLAKDGQAALDAKDFKTAEDRFKRAVSLYDKAPTLHLGLARAYVGTGKYVEAQESYRRVINQQLPPNAPAAFKKAQDDAQAEVGTVTPHIGSVVVNVTGGESPKVTIDELPVPTAALGVKRAANPGSHVIKAQADGYKTAEMTVTVVEGGSAVANLTMEKDPNWKPATAGGPVNSSGTTIGAVTADTGTPKTNGSTLRTLGWIGIGVGGASLVAGAITGGMAAGKNSELKSACTNGVCPPDQKSNVDSYNTLGAVSTATFIAGGVLAAAGVALVILAPSGKGHEKTAIVPVIGPGSLGLVGTF